VPLNEEALRVLRRWREQSGAGMRVFDVVTGFQVRQGVEFLRLSCAYGESPVEQQVSNILILMVEREGLEPAGRMMRISKLLTLLEYVPPPPPSNPRIWHSIWHWNRHPRGQSEPSRDSRVRSAGQSPSPETSGSGPLGDAPEPPSSPASTSRSRMA
jgi:hypothetical protein